MSQDQIFHPGPSVWVNQVLVLNIMHYPDEIRKPEGIGLPSSEVKLGDRELEMADLLVKSMSGEFQPVEAKLLPTNVIDIVARLKASIDQAEEQKKVKKARG